MTHDPRSAEFDDELLSAYLDEELSPAERALVEERLASDPAARALLEQLRGVSHSLQALPTEKLDADLSGSVVASAERAMPAARPTYPRIASDPDTSHEGASPAEELPPFSVGRTRRGWFWAAATLAAALLIAFVEPEGEEEKVALREPAATKSLRIGEVEMRSLDRLDEEALHAEHPLGQTMTRDLGAPQDQLAEQTLADRNDDSARIVEFQASPNNNYFAEDSPPPPATSAPPAPPDMKMEEPASPPADALAVRSGAIDPGVSSAADAGIEPSMPEIAGERDRAEVPPEPAPPSLSDAPADTARSRLAGELSEGENLPRSTEVELGGAGGMQPMGDAYLTISAASTPAIVVQLSAKPDAFQERSIDRLLVDHGISVEEMPTGDSPSGADGAAAKEALGESGVNSAIGSDEATRSKSLDILSVDASPAQVEALLATLQKDEANFTAVDVKAPATLALDAASGTAEDWTRFNRGSLSYGYRAGQATAQSGGYGAIAAAAPPPPADVQARGATASGAAPRAQAADSSQEELAPQTSFGRSQPEAQDAGVEGRVGRARRYTNPEAAFPPGGAAFHKSPQESEPGDRSQFTGRSDIVQRVESAAEESATRNAAPQSAGIEHDSASLPSERLFQADAEDNINVLFVIRPAGAPQPAGAPPPSAEETE